MVSKTRQPKPDLLTAADQAPDCAAALAQVAHTDDVVEYTLRCVLALAPGLSEAVARLAEAQVRGTFGGDRVYVARRQGEGTSERNAAIRRDFARGERVELLVRRYGVSRTHVYRILGADAGCR